MKSLNDPYQYTVKHELLKSILEHEWKAYPLYISDRKQAQVSAPYVPSLVCIECFKLCMVTIVYNMPIL